MNETFKPWLMGSHHVREGSFHSQRLETFVFASVGVALAATSTGLAVSGALNPSQPNLTAASQQMALAQAYGLPEMDALQAAAALGTTAQYTASPADAKKELSYQNKISKIEGKLATDPGNQKLQADLTNFQTKLAAVPQSTANFSGYSTADIQGPIMDQLAAGQLATEKEFDPQFIASALQQEQQANPQGVAARGAEYDTLQNLIANPPQSPVSDEMQRQVTDRVQAGSGLTPEEQAQLDQSVNEMAGSGITGTGTGPDYSSALTTGFEGSQRDLANTAAGAQFLAGGGTPDDIAYRANQQNIADLSQFYSGQTPQAQFKSLTGAQGGATPIVQNAPLPQVNQGAGAQGAAAAVQQYGLQTQQPSSWTTGLSGALGLANIGASMVNG